MKKFQEFVNEAEWWGKKGKERVSARRAQWAKQGLLKKKSKPYKSTPEKDSAIKRAAKKAGMSSKERKGLYNQFEESKKQ